MTTFVSALCKYWSLSQIWQAIKIKLKSHLTPCNIKNKLQYSLIIINNITVRYIDNDIVHYTDIF